MPTLVAGGALVGALTGAIVVEAASCNPNYDSYSDYSCASDEELGKGAWIGAAVGAVGGLIGASFIRKELWAPASLPDWAHPPKVTLGLAPVRRGVGLRVTVAF